MAHNTPFSSPTGVGSVFTFFNVYLDSALGVSTAQIGVLLGIGRLLAVPVALATPLLGARFGNRRLVVWATFGIAFSLLPLGLIPHRGVATIGFIGVVVLTSMRLPAFLVYTMDAVPPQARAATSGASEMANGLGFAAIALSGGYIVAGFGFHSLFLMCAALTAIGTFIFWGYDRLPRCQILLAGRVAGGGEIVR